jgi:thiosulfate reductase cytochrome b subunit
VFAALRIAEVSLAVLGGLALLLALTPSATPGSTTRALHFIAWSTPLLFIVTAALLLAVAGVLRLISIPLKRRWASQLRGWIR